MKANIFNILGSILLLLASILLLVTSITAPVVNDLAILTVDLPEDAPGKEVSFGTFGWCVQDGKKDGGDLCSDAKVGYNPADVMFAIDGTETASYSRTTTKALTRVMVLHPVGAILNFVAFGLALGASVLGSLMATIFALAAFLVTALVMVCDFVLFGILRSDINEGDSGSHAYFSVGMWCVLVSAIASLLASVIMFASCCVATIRKRRDKSRAANGVEAAAPPASEKPVGRRGLKFWQRR